MMKNTEKEWLYDISSINDSQSKIIYYFLDFELFCLILDLLIATWLNLLEALFWLKLRLTNLVCYRFNTHFAAGSYRQFFQLVIPYTQFSVIPHHAQAVALNFCIFESFRAGLIWSTFVWDLHSLQAYLTPQGSRWSASSWEQSLNFTFEL